jgi:hypothetical protein
VWWTIFTGIDLYIGLIVIDSLVGSVPADKQRLLAAARKIILVALGVTMLVLAAQILRGTRLRAFLP